MSSNQLESKLLKGGYIILGYIGGYKTGDYFSGGGILGLWLISRLIRAYQSSLVSGGAY